MSILMVLSLDGGNAGGALSIGASLMGSCDSDAVVRCFTSPPLLILTASLILREGEAGALVVQVSPTGKS